MRALSLDNATRKELAALPDKHFRQVISAVFALLKDPRPADSRQLSGHPFYRITVGEYRVVYDYSDSQVRILAFGKRNDGEVYRQLLRKQQ
jgi:mRNA interferase RelE/StbE